MNRSLSGPQSIHPLRFVACGLAAVYFPQVVVLHALAASVEQGLLPFAPVWIVIHLSSIYFWGKLSDYVSKRSILSLHATIAAGMLIAVVIMRWNPWTILLVAVMGNPIAAVQSMFLRAITHLKPRIPASIPLLVYCLPFLWYNVIRAENENFGWNIVVFLGLAGSNIGLGWFQLPNTVASANDQSVQIPCFRREIVGILLPLLLAMAGCFQPSLNLYHTTEAMWVTVPGFVVIASIVLSLFLSHRTDSYLINFCYGIPLAILVALLCFSFKKNYELTDLTNMVMFAGSALPIVYEIMAMRYTPACYGHMFGLTLLAFGGGIALSIAIFLYCPRTLLSTLVLPTLFLATAFGLHRRLNIELDKQLDPTM